MASLTLQTPSQSPQSTSTRMTTPEPATEEDNDIWDSDDAGERANHENGSTQSELMSNLPALRRQHMTDGYREGLSLGKAKVMQSGFDQGYPIGVSIALRAGKILGVLEGILALKNLKPEEKVGVQNMYQRAKQDLSVSTLLKDISDESVMNELALNKRMDDVVKKWEAIVFGPEA